MIFVLYNNRSECSFRFEGRVLARQAGLGTLSLETLSKQRGISLLFRGKR